MTTENDNKGYLLTLICDNSNDKVEKIFLNPKILYIPDVCQKKFLLLTNELKGQNRSLSPSADFNAHQ